MAFDEHYLGRALANLVQNALEHTPAGGSVVVRARLGAAPADTVEVEVADTGEGIDPDQLAHVFDRFFRGDQSRPKGRGGAGLGLAIVREVVSAHGGEVGVDSRPGTGTRLSFRIPRRAAGRKRALGGIGVAG